MRHDESPDAALARDGWRRWAPEISGFVRILGPVHARAVPGKPNMAEVRWVPEEAHVNLLGYVHGGALATAVDIALFAGAAEMGEIRPGTATTVDLSIHYMIGARIGAPILIEVEAPRVTRRLIFLRGVARQDQGEGETAVLGFTGLIRRTQSPPFTEAAPFC